MELSTVAAGSGGAAHQPAVVPLPCIDGVTVVVTVIVTVSVTVVVTVSITKPITVDVNTGIIQY